MSLNYDHTNDSITPSGGTLSIDGTLNATAVNVGGTALGVSQLADVVITSLTTNDILQWNGASWVNGPVTVSNADTVDSLHASSFMRSDADAITTGSLRYGKCHNYDSGNLNSVTESGFFDGSNMSNAPTTDWCYVEVIRHSSNPTVWMMQKAHHFFSDTTWVRRMQNSVWGSWYKVWNEYTDGGGSGLNADLLDGLNSSSFLRSDATNTTGTFTNMNLDGAIYSVGDTNTYMQFNAADTWRVVTGGGQRLYADNNGAGVNGTLYINGNVAWHAGNINPLVHDTIGSVVLACRTTTNAGFTFGSTWAGSGIRVSGLWDNAGGAQVMAYTGPTLTGTWRALSEANAAVGYYSHGIFVRIA